MLLRLVPREPLRTDTRRLEQQLIDEGVVVTRRSIQRDLERLAARFSTLKCNAKSKPYQWSWDTKAPIWEIPGMGLQAALTFELVRAHLEPTLPRSTLASLEPHFARARQVLREQSNVPLARWLSKVRVVPRGLPLIAPDIERRVLDVVYAALLEDKRFRVLYRKHGAAEEREYVVSPLGLGVRNGTLSLVCTFWDYDDVTHMLLHRMRRPELLDQRVHRPRKFDLDRHLEEGGFGFARGAPIRLRMLAHRDLAVSLAEAPLGKDQRQSDHDPEHVLIRVTVPNSMELRGWLLSYGSLLEVLEPKALRDELTETTRAMAARYGRRRKKR